MRHSIPGVLATILLLAAATAFCPGPAAEAQQTCPNPETVSGPKVHARVGSWKRQSVIDVQEAVYNPPPGCYIRECKAHSYGSFGLTSHRVSGLAPDSSFLSEQEIHQIYKSTSEFAAQLAAQAGNTSLNADLQGLLKSELDRHLQYSFAIRSSHAACHVYAKATGRGTFVDKGSSIELGVDVSLCCGLFELQDSASLERFLRERIERRAAQVPSNPRWTPWLNRDTPGGTGDFETLQDFLKTGQVPQSCSTPQKIECRLRDTAQLGRGRVQLGRGTTQLVGTGTVNGQQVTCEPTVGGVCDNRKQNPGVACSDYEVRFLCP